MINKMLLQGAKYVSDKGVTIQSKPASADKRSPNHPPSHHSDQTEQKI